MFSLLDDMISQTEASEFLPTKIPILPLRGTVAYPFIILPLSIGVPRSVKLIKAASQNDNIIGLIVSKEPDIDEPSPDQLHEVGVVARIHRVLRSDKGSLQVIVQGLERFKIKKWIEEDPYITADVEITPDTVNDEAESALEALRRRIVELSNDIVEYLPQIPNEVSQFLDQVEDPRIVLYTTASNLRMEFEDRLELLFEDDLQDKMTNLVQIMSRELEVLEIGQQIRSETQGELDKTQRDFYLRQQLKAIQKELGEDEEQATNLEYREKIESSGMPEEPKKEALRELDRLEKLQPQSAEYGVIQTYLDWMVELPWSKLTDDNLNISNARDVLNTDHYDMDDVKERILEYLAVRKLRAERKFDQEPLEPGREQDRAGGSILMFVGPPGVGKTSLGRSIARALGREFTRMSLGGVRDEAEIRGHRRTYIGALPGRIIQALKRCGTRNPVFMLDEVDKIGSDWRGDPSSALLEVLDPQQNYAFRDHYLDVDFDLSEVMFIATANTRDTIPAPLLDRMEVIQLDGYTEYEKIAIAEGYLMPRQIKANGLLPDEIGYTQAGLRQIIRDYTREAGVRNLEREIGRFARKVATKVALRHDDTDSATTTQNGHNKKAILIEQTLIIPDTVREFLGKPKFFFEAAQRTENPGVATGLAVTPVGGDVLFIEAARMVGKDRLTLTGQLGDVMKESAQIALSYVRAHADDLQLDISKLNEADIHLHVPAGAVPKDGPSAGITMVTALVSLLSGRPVRAEVGMTGEISLQGQVLPIGGLKQKALAAHRAGLTTIIAPKRNEPDLDDLPEEVRQDLTFHLTEKIDEVLHHALRVVS
ncbi:endopeptidase La [Anaerolineales bacterium HSG6]|nr:endopeptidase La [Anaerolineales bacterium HSG6]MDM8531278.1 endopeptidase La [Anaerolineales bacterium HSG25]